MATMSTEPYMPDENDLINEYARSSLEDWHNEEWAEKDKASARRCIAKIKADALREAARSVEEVDDRRGGLLFANWLRARAHVIEESRWKHG